MTIKKRPLKPVAVQPTAAPIDKELLDKVQCLRALATCHNLIDNGLYPHQQSDLVKQSLDFLRVLHSNVSVEALGHAQADLVPELKAVKEAQAKQGAI